MTRPVGEPNLLVFASTLLELAQKDRNIIVVTSDSRGSGKLVAFGEQLPDQIVEVGVAEQHLVGMAAGLASCGKKVFAVSPACFLTARALEHIKNDIAYSDYPVTLVGISAGVSYGALGSTHHSLHDLAALRAVSNIDIVVPGDNFETREAVTAAVDHPRPLYIRFGKKAMAHLYKQPPVFTIGKANLVKQGNDIAFISTGETTEQAFAAAQELEGHGISGRVISMHTIKPLDVECICQTAQECKVIITVEEHSIHGGLGEACASVILEAGIHTRFHSFAVQDEETVTGSQMEIYTHYGLAANGLVTSAKKMLQI